MKDLDPKARASARPGRWLVRARGVTVRRRGRVILEDVDIAVAAREVVSLVGPNGAGKTTLLRVLLGLEKPEAGEVVRRRGLRIGYVPQRLAVDPVLPLSVCGFLELAPRAPGASPATVLAEVGLGERARRQLWELSGGELRRLLFARALLGRPELLLLDEPVDGVDLQGQSLLYRLIGYARQRLGCGVLLVGHELHLVFAESDRVLCLDRRLQCVGTPVQVARDPAFRRLFGDQLADLLAPFRHSPHRADGGAPP